MREEVITIRDVARQAGVSPSTVSHVLNGKDRHVGLAKREKVLEVIRQLNYRPNAIARSMIRRATFTIGLVITELQNPLFVPVTEGVEEVLRAEGYHIVLASASGIEGEIRAIETLRQQQVDGFIFMSLSLRYSSPHLTQLKEAGVPFITINRYLDDKDINQIQIDDREAAYTATQHLFSLGHTCFGTVAGPINSEVPRVSALQRYRGWHEALQEHGLSVLPENVLIGDYTFEGGYKAAQQLLAQTTLSTRPTALFIANESMAVGTLKALYEGGLRVPQDMAVVTIGDAPFVAYTIPALTALALPVDEAGRIAARRLVEWLKAGQPPQAETITLSCRLIVRDSCGAKLKGMGNQG
jgi:LacI family transcriptional regulator